MGGTTRNTKVLNASTAEVYNAFTEKKALEFWLAPKEMTGKIHDFDLRVGGGYTMSLIYQNNEGAGKSSAHEDRFTAKFVELKPAERIVQKINFQSDKKEFSGEMKMEVFLEEKEKNSTLVTIVFTNIPAGIKPEDNETGTEQSLEKLAQYLQTKSSH